MHKIITSILILFALSILTAVIIQRAQNYQAQNYQASLVSLKNTIPKDLVGVWIWAHTFRPNGEEVTSNSPKDFILTFDSSGKIQSTTDCNFLNGSVMVRGSQINLNSASLTEMFCSENVLESVYAQDLNQIQYFMIDGDVLLLELSQNGGHMAFVRF